MLPALFVRAEGVQGPAPVMVHCNGLDSTKEMIYWSGIGQELARRGVSLKRMRKSLEQLRGEVCRRAGAT